MKFKIAAWSLLCVALPVTAQTAIHKCTVERVVVYQDTPCSHEQMPLPLGTTMAQSSNAANATPVEVKQENQPKLLMQSANLAVGMTDTQVLNLQGWGRPSNIKRSKTKGGWVEAWTYATSAEAPRLLLFANGTLTAITTEPVESTTQQIVQVTAQ